MPYYNRDPKRDHNFDNHPRAVCMLWGFQSNVAGPSWCHVPLRGGAILAQLSKRTLAEPIQDALQLKKKIPAAALILDRISPAICFRAGPLCRMPPHCPKGHGRSSAGRGSGETSFNSRLLKRLHRLRSCFCPLPSAHAGCELRFGHGVCRRSGRGHARVAKMLQDEAHSRVNDAGKLPKASTCSCCIPFFIFPSPRLGDL